MKEVLGSLPEVITAYKNYNLLVPTATDVQLNPFYKFHTIRRSPRQSLQILLCLGMKRLEASH